MKTRNVALLLVLAVVFLAGCSEKSGSAGERRGEPVMTHEGPVFDENTATFSLTVKADSAEGATLVFSLIAGDSIVAANNDGQFAGIAPLEEGYDVRMEVQWADTVIERISHVMDFIVPKAPVEKISPEDFAALINSKDESLRNGTNEHLAQGVVFRVVESSLQPQMLPDAIVLLENSVWKGVEVVKLEYDQNNLITEVTVRPVGEKTDVIDDDEDYDY